MLIEVAGRRAYAYTGGKPFDTAKPTVVFVHGGQQDHSCWILQSRYFAHHGWSVLALDLPGHGRSEGPALDSIEAMADWVIGTLDAVGASRAAMVGHSMGSLIALDAAGRYPGRVERIALLGSAFPMRVSDALLAAARDDEPAAFEMINLWSHSGISHRPGNPGPGFSVFVENLRLMERQAAGVLFKDFNACNAYAAGVERARAITCPTLFVVGASDMMTPPKAARALASEIAGAQTVEIPRCGHSMMAERPDAVLQALTAFCGPMHAAAPA